jgi:7-keto-8-aminopelargonate synthetase and related enzymes
MKIVSSDNALIQQISMVRNAGVYTLYRPIEKVEGPEVVINGRRMIMVGSNDYLGLATDPRVMEASSRAISRFGTGPGGSRILCGNILLHEELEARVAAALGKKWALIFTTGFMANLGAISTIAESGDIFLCDKECHASIIEGCRMSRCRIATFAHNDFNSALSKLEKLIKTPASNRIFLITEGVFSMSGRVAPLDKLVKLKDIAPNLITFVDDAHGFGVLGGGRGTAHSLGCTDQIDIISGTFSKAFASIGGFIASDDKNLKDYLKHRSRALIFSAALPAASTAAALKVFDIIAEEPERITRLIANATKIRNELAALGFTVNNGGSPIISVSIGSDEAAHAFVMLLDELGIFAVSAVYPAVSRGASIIRLALTSNHEDRHISQIIEAFATAKQRLQF